MTTLAFDSLRYARRLREAGVPEPQADAQAELMAEAFGFYADNILTKDHFEGILNSRFGEFRAQMDQRFAEQDAKFDNRLAEQNARFDQRFADIDRRFSEQDAKFDQRFAEQNAKLDNRFAEQDAKFEGRFSKLERSSFLNTWILGILVVVIVIPQLQSWLV